MFTKSSDEHAGTRPRRWVALSVVLVALGVAGCGSSGSSNSGTSSSSSTPAAPTETKAPAEETIPQGPNAGDKDSDNSGGPSDGDGNK
jgi:hypothetical protein